MLIISIFIALSTKENTKKILLIIGAFLLWNTSAKMFNNDKKAKELKNKK